MFYGGIFIRQKNLTGKKSYGEMSLLQSILMAKYRCAAISLRRNVFMTNCPDREMKYDETSYSEVSHGENSYSVEFIPDSS